MKIETEGGTAVAGGETTPRGAGFSVESSSVRQIPFYRPNIEQAEIDEVVDTLRKGWLTTGPKTKLFEAEFAQYMKQPHAVAVNSCTAALHLALEAVGLRAGEAVLVPTMTFAATAEVVQYFGADPILIDCRERDLNWDLEDAERKLEAAERAGRRVRAILPVHYGGQVGEVEGLARLARERRLEMIEDAAHCCPAFYRRSGEEKWSPAGTLGTISCFSFYANKTITTGEGGMACTADAGLADRMRIMSLHGISRDAWKRFSADGSWYYEITAPGYKYNLTDVAASLGIHQLRKADRLHSRRRFLARLYQDQLGDCEELLLPEELPDRVHSWHLFAARLRLDRLGCDRAEFIAELKREGIGTSVHWMPLHMHPHYRTKYGCRAEDCPKASEVYPRIVSLPLFPDMTDEDAEYVCRVVKRVLARHLK